MRELSEWVQPWSYLSGEVRLLHRAARVDADYAEDPFTGVLEAMGRMRRHDDDVSARDRQLLLSHGEGGLSLLHEEDLGIGMLVQRGPTRGGASPKKNACLAYTVCVVVIVAAASVTISFQLGRRRRPPPPSLPRKEQRQGCA